MSHCRLLSLCAEHRRTGKIAGRVYLFVDNIAIPIAMNINKDGVEERDFLNVIRTISITRRFAGKQEVAQAFALLRLDRIVIYVYY